MTGLDPHETPTPPDRELDGLGPAEWAFQTLLRIAAWGLHGSRQHELRVMTLTARDRYRAANSEESAQ